MTETNCKSTNSIVDLDTLVWKTNKGTTKRMMDMDADELQSIYNHTTDMLYNTNRYTPGKVRVKNNIKMLIQNCNAELLRRYLLYECSLNNLNTDLQIIEFLRVKKTVGNLKNTDFVTQIFSNLPQQFSDITIGKLLDASLDNLDVINRNMISDKFILSQGIWLTENERQELTEMTEDGKKRNWKDVVKERLLLPDYVEIRSNSHGFTYNEFRSLIQLGTLSKISSLSSNTLVLLRDKVFILLDVDNDYHIDKWEGIKQNIEAIANYKKIQLIPKEYK